MYKQSITIIEYQRNSKGTGVETYIQALTHSLPKEADYTLNIIYLDAEKEEKICNSGITTYYVTRQDTPLSRPHQALFWAQKLISLLEIDSLSSGNKHIFHFNWIEHYDIAGHLKRLCLCQTLLTVHYVPWKNLVSTNYPLFYKINMLSKSDDYTSDKGLLDERKVYHTFDRIITVTKGAKDNLVNLLRIPASKIDVIYNGKEEYPINEKKQELRKKYLIEPSEIVILHVGAVNKRKGIRELLMSFDGLVRQGHHNIRLIVAGSGPIDSFLSGNDIISFSKITWTGFQSEKVVNELISLADIGVLLSYTEQCSYAVIEMMAKKLPVVVTDIDGLQEMVINYVNGFKVGLEYHMKDVYIDIIGLTASLDKLIKDRTLRSAFGDMAYKEYLSRFTVGAMCSETYRVYSSLIAQQVDEINQNCLNIIVPISGNRSQLTDREKEVLRHIVTEYYPNKLLHICINAIHIDSYKKEFDSLLPSDVEYKIYGFDQNTTINSCLVSLIQELEPDSLITINMLNGVGLKNRYSSLSTYLSRSSSLAVSSPYFVIKDDYETVSRQSYPDFVDNSILLECLAMFNASFDLSNIVFKSHYLQSLLPVLGNIDLILWTKIVLPKDTLIVKEYLFSKFIDSQNKRDHMFAEQSLLLIVEELIDFCKKNQIDFSPEDIKTHTAINYHIQDKLDNNQLNIDWITKFNFITKKIGVGLPDLIAL